MRPFLLHLLTVIIRHTGRPEARLMGEATQGRAGWGLRVRVLVAVWSVRVHQWLRRVRRQQRAARRVRARAVELSLSGVQALPGAHLNFVRRWPIHRIGAGALGLLLIYSIVFASVPTKAATTNLGKADMLGGTADFNGISTAADGSISLQKGDIGQWHGYDGVQEIPDQERGDSDVIFATNNHMYYISYIANCRFLTYDVEMSRWSDVTAPPVSCADGVSLAYDGSKTIYYLPGGDSSAFFSYNISTDAWTKLPDLPLQVGNGAHMTFVQSGGGYVFAFRGKTSNLFYRYDVAAKVWQQRSPFPATSSVGYGLDLAWDGSASIYAISNYYNEYKKYSILSDSWQNLTAPPNGTNFKNRLMAVNGLIIDMRLHWCCGDEQMFAVEYSPTNDSWTNLATPPIGNIYDYQPTAVFDGQDNIYTLVGADIHKYFMRYSVSTNSWNNEYYLAGNNDATFYHWEPQFDGNHTVYYLGGAWYGNLDRVYKYDLSTKVTTQIGFYPQVGPRMGITGTYYNNALYMVPYFGNTTFKKFDLTTKDWVDLPDFPYTSDWGSDLVDGGDGYLYATFGNRRNFYRFSEAGGWQALASLPTSVTTPYAGGIARIGTSLYLLLGHSSANMLRYDIPTNTWTVLPTYTPNGDVDHGDFLIGDSSRYLYIGTGTRHEGDNRRMYRYDTQTGSWKRMADLPADSQVGAFGFYDTTANRLYLAPGVIMPFLWYWTPTSATYATSGAWYSKALDLTQVQTWTSLTASQSGSGQLNFYTRTSSDKVFWSAWQQVSGTTINSPPNRYAQIKVVLSGTGSNTATVSGLQLQYTQEASPPSVPSQFFAKGSKDGPDLTSGTTYEYEHPYFSWNGASDGANGSGVDGYYVYFGTDSNANPQTDGNYQTTTDYTVTTAMDAGSVYYFRISVKDRLGNVSAASTYFSYRYFYISPPGSVLKTTKDDFSSGTNTSVDLTSVDGSMRLKQSATGSWATGPLTTMPDTSSGGAAAVVGDFMYMARGSNSATFWRYDIVNQQWETLQDAPNTVNTGSSMVWDKGNYLYLIRGNSATDLYRYNITTGDWTTLPQLPIAARSGTDMAYLGSGNLAILFTGSTDFYIFDGASQTYNNKASLPEIVDSYRAGAGLWYDGNGNVYAYLGGYYSQDYVYRSNMAVYSVAQDSWRVLARPPVNMYYTENNLVSDGAGHLYIFGNDSFYNNFPQNMGSRYDIASDTWQAIPTDYAITTRGTVASDGSRYIYIVPSTGGSRKLVRYDTWNNQMVPLVSQPSSWHRLPWDEVSGWNWTEGQATTAAFDGTDTVYALGGNEGDSSQFIGYSVSSQTTTHLPPPPYIAIGGSLAFVNNYLYYSPARSRQDFYRYNPARQIWEAMAQFPATVYRPGSTTLVSDGSGSLYAFRGNSSTFYKYTPDAGIGSWGTLAAIPGSILNGSAVYDGNGNIYALQANGTSNFYRYSVAANSWSTMASLPTTVSYGDTMVLSNGQIFATDGNYRSETYVYNIAGNSWTPGPTTPEPFRYGGTMVTINSQMALGFAGQDNPDIWQFNFPASGAGYAGQAVHISQPIQVNGLFDYAGINVEADIPNNTNVEIWTRTSADSNNWDNWQIADQVKHYSGQLSARVASNPQKYIQIKLILSSFDNVHTPTVGSYELSYYFDVDPPTNPSVATVYADSSKAQTLTNNTWYNYPKVLIDWPDPGEAGGATDGLLGSHIKGYWIYVGTDQTALPSTAGTFVTSSEFETNLTQSGTYFARIQAQDLTGNIDASVFAPFVYKFDMTPPTNPPFISVTPSGFTSKNDFSFQWPNAFDGDSGIAAYCYHTGATSGPFSTETCTTDLHLDHLSAAYLSGTNVFYLRTKDVAGNFSASYAQVSFYYSTDPPGPVQNLRAIPPVSAQNLFAFAWDLPALFAGDPNRLTYCYSINVLPTSINTTCTTDRFISAFKAATQQGTNILYMVAKDEANNVNWNSYATANFIANTVSPGIPLNLVATDSSDRASNRWSITLTWSKPTFEGNGVDHYNLERSTDGHTFTGIGSVSNTAFVDMTVAPENTYYYRVRASDNVDNVGGPSGIVSQQAQGRFVDPPQIVSNPTINPSFDRADVSWVTARAATSFVYYGTKPNDLSQSKGTLDTVTDHTVTLTGLSASSVYYFKVQSFDLDRNYSLSDAFSQIYSFRTTETARVFNVTSSDVGLSSALLSWQTSVPTKARIEYGTNTDYGLFKDDDSGTTTTHLLRLDSLPSGTTYHFRIVATTDYGSQVNSDDYSLTTLPYPQVSNIKFQPIVDAPTIAVKISWTTNVATDSVVSYSALGDKKEAAASELTTNHEMELDDLAGNAAYTVVLRGRDQFGNPAVSDPQTWHSQIDTRPPQISQISIDVATMGVWGNNKAQLIVSWKTDEPASSQVQFGGGLDGKLSQQTAVDPDPTTDHVVVISNLDMAKVYRVKPISKDISGNTAFGAETTTVTPDSQSSLLQIILHTLQVLLGEKS